MRLEKQLSLSKLTCEYCRLDFKRQVNFEKHECNAMEKFNYLRTPQGQAAFHYYKEWLKLSKHNGSIKEDTFLSSRYFTSFQKFMDYSNKMMLPNKTAFIKYMISLNMQPSSWSNDEVYVKYIENLDQSFTPSEQAEETVKTLYELSRIFECKVNEVFLYLEAGDCVRLLKTRKLSPWVLLLSSLFYSYMQTKLSLEQQNIIQSVINPLLWRNKFENAKNDVIYMKEIVKELDL